MTIMLRSYWLVREVGSEPATGGTSYDHDGVAADCSGNSFPPGIRSRDEQILKYREFRCLHVDSSIQLENRFAGIMSLQRPRGDFAPAPRKKRAAAE
jgi:hypothetical protein